VSQRLIDWSGNCGNLSSAVAPFAIDQGLVKASDGICVVRLWQSNLAHRIDAHVPVLHGKPLEAGGFMEDGVPFGAAQIRLEFHEAQAATDGEPLLPLLPTAQVQEVLPIAGLGPIAATLITAGHPTVFIKAQSLGLTGKETPEDLLRKRKLMGWLEAIRAQGAVRMGLAASESDATLLRPGTPKVAWVAPASAYLCTTGKMIAAHDIDLLARMLSLGKMHESLTSAVSVALAAAAALPGSVVHEIARTLPGLPTRIGHPSGILAVGAQVRETLQGWRFERAVFSRSARRLISGLAHVPAGWAVESDPSR
jgi:2-methylaconitate cis-trans-isomerase PrpF